MVMQDLEKIVLEDFINEIPFYYRYVDDILTAVPRQKTKDLLNRFNSFHPRMQFTIEIGGNRLNFLDATIINDNNVLEFDWYMKPTFSGRMLNYLSNHPLTQKRGVVMNMVDRAFLLSHPKFHQKNFNLIIDTLLSNDYPLQFIFDTISTRLKTLFKKRTKKQNNEDLTNEDRKRWFVVPFIEKLTDKFKNIAKILKTKLAFYSLHKLNRIVKAQKDHLPIEMNKNVVYKLACKNCDVAYVGQTKRKLNTRISEHKKDIKKTSNHSVITEHRIAFDHHFDWENPKILDIEEHYQKRLISEMINIKAQKNTINLQSDTEYLQYAYIEILNKIHK